MTFDRIEAGYERLYASWDQTPPRHFDYRCPKCLRGLIEAPKFPIPTTSGREVMVCESCHDYDVEWARWEAQAQQQASHNREQRR